MSLIFIALGAFILLVAAFDLHAGWLTRDTAFLSGLMFVCTGWLASQVKDKE